MRGEVNYIGSAKSSDAAESGDVGWAGDGLRLHAQVPGTNGRPGT